MVPSDEFSNCSGIGYRLEWDDDEISLELSPESTLRLSCLKFAEGCYFAPLEFRSLNIYLSPDDFFEVDDFFFSKLDETG